jgi:hypothetical protein
VRRFDWRGRRPLLDLEPIVLCGAWRDVATLDLWTGAERGNPFISAAASL